jgi:hypothetical protein
VAEKWTCTPLSSSSLPIYFWMNVQSLTVRHHRLLFVNRYLPRTPRQCYSSTPRGWRKYTEQFKNKPGSYITTFVILHELTAIVPFPFIYYGLSWSDLHLPVPEQAIRQGNLIVNKVRVRYGFDALEPDNRAMVHLATTYAIVKVRLNGWDMYVCVTYYG